MSNTLRKCDIGCVHYRRDSEAAMQKLNVLWITCDEMRWDALPCNGNATTSMPAAERLAMEGMSFSSTFCQMPKCVPSRCSMLTGRYPHVDGFRTLRGRRFAPDFAETGTNDLLALQEETPNIVPIMRDAGYRTCLLGKNHVVEWNLHKKWFDTTPGWQFHKVPDTETREDLQRASYGGVIPDDYPYAEHFDAVTADEAISFFEEASDRPFFALVDISLPHPKYHTFPEMPSAKVPLQEVPKPPVSPVEEVPFVECAIRTSKNLEHLTDDDRRLIRRAYYSMCEFGDRQVARILDALDRLGMAENTLVIYTSDHGDFAGDHNCFEKWDTAFKDSIVRVPLLLRLPGRIPAGGRCDALVELVDLFPTILEAAGLGLPSYAQGRSLWPLIHGHLSGWRSAVLCQGGVERPLTKLAVQPQTPGSDPVKQQVLVDFPEAMARAKMLRTETHKYIHRLSGHHEFYDLVADPHELANLIDEPSEAARIAEFRQQLIDKLIESESTLPEVSKLYA